MFVTPKEKARPKILKVLLALGSLNKEAQHAVHLPSARLRMRQGVSEGTKGMGWDGGESGSPPTPAHVCPCMHSHSLSAPVSPSCTNSFPWLSLCLLLLSLWYFSLHALSLSVSSDLWSPSLSHFLPCLPPSPHVYSSSSPWHLLPPSTALPLPPMCAYRGIHTLYLLYCIFTVPFLYLDMFRYTSTYYCVHIAYSIQYRDMSYKLVP